MYCIFAREAWASVSFAVLSISDFERHPCWNLFFAAMSAWLMRGACFLCSGVR